MSRAWVRAGLLAVVVVALAGYYSMTTPIFEAPDELWHYLVVADLAHGRLADPAGPARQEATQPPLYYAAGALLWRLAPAPDPDAVLVRNPYFDYQPGGSANRNLIYHDGTGEAFPFTGIARTVHLVRLLSVALAALAVLGVYRLGRVVAPSRPRLAFLAAAACLLNPEFLFVAGAISNDLAIVATTTWTLVFLAEWVRDRSFERRNATLWALGALLALALLSKATAFGLAFLMGVALLRYGPAGERQLRRAGRAVAVVGGALLVAGGWYLRLWLLYGDPLGVSVHAEALGRTAPFSVGEAVADLAETAITFFARFGWSNVVAPIEVPLVFLVVAVAGLALGLARPEVRRSPGFRVQLGWIGLMLVLFYAWQLKIPSPQGRLTFPAMGSLALIWAAGVDAALDRLGVIARIGLAAALGGPALAAVLAMPSAVIAPAYAAPPEELLPTLPATARPLAASFGNQVSLVGYATPEGDWRPGETRNVRLFWQRGADAGTALSFDVRAVDAGGKVVAGHDGSLAPTLPLPIWPTDRVVAIDVPLDLPADAPTPEVLRLDVGAYAWTNGQIRHLAAEPGGESVEIAALRVVGAERPWPAGPVARFGNPADAAGAVDLLGWSVDDALARPGGTVRGRLTWLAPAPLRTDYTVFVHLTRGASILAQQDGPPLAGAFPTTAWRPGEVVDDGFSLTLPADLAPGPADLEVGLYDLKTMRRLPLPSGDAWKLTTLDVE